MSPLPKVRYRRTFPFRGDRGKGPESLRVFGCLPVTWQCVARGGRASEKPRGRKPRGEFAPAVVSGYGDLAPVFDVIFDFRSGETAERVPRPWF